ncbi:hypothetical protein B7945_15780, partial [Vibrio cholerae]
MELSLQRPGNGSSRIFRLTNIPYVFTMQVTYFLSLESHREPADPSSSCRADPVFPDQPGHHPPRRPGSRQVSAR